MELCGALLQFALGLGRAIAHPQIVEPSGTMKSFDPGLRIGDIACDRPSISAVALTAQLDLLHDRIEPAGLRVVDSIFNLDHDGAAAASDLERDLRLGQNIGCVGVRSL